MQKVFKLSLSANLEEEPRALEILTGAGNSESFFTFLYFWSIQSWCTLVLLIFFFLQVKFLQEVTLGNTSVTPSQITSHLNPLYLLILQLFLFYKQQQPKNPMVFVWDSEVYPINTVDGFTQFCAVTSVVYTVSTVMTSLFREKKKIASMLLLGRLFFPSGSNAILLSSSLSVSQHSLHKYVPV